MAALDDLPRHRWTREEYQRLDRDTFRHTELIQGEIVDMSPMSGAHAYTTSALTRAFFDCAPSEYWVACQIPVVLRPDTEPEPDVWVSTHRPRTEDEGKPVTADLVLVAEVSDSSLGIDRRYKVPMYGAAGVAECWLVDVRAKTVTVHANPFEGGYHAARTYGIGDVVPTPWGATIGGSALFVP